MRRSRWVINGQVVCGRAAVVRFAAAWAHALQVMIGRTTGFGALSDQRERAVPPADTLLSVASHEMIDGGIAVVPSGEIDLTTAPMVERELCGVQASHALVVLDLRQVSFMDSTGLAMLLDAHRRARDNGGSFVVVQGQPQSVRLLALCGLDEHLEMCDELPSGPMPSASEAPA